MRRLAALGCLLLTLFLTGCTGETFTPNADVKPAGSELTVCFVSDLHLLSEELTDQSPEFLTMIARGDGKTAHYSQEIGQALVWQITSLPEEERPDVLLAAGDLTFNGEKLSHETVAGLFEEIAGADLARQPRCEQRHGLPLYRQYGRTHRNGHSPGVPGDLPGLWLGGQFAAGYRVDELCLGAGGGSLDHRH